MTAFPDLPPIDGAVAAVNHVFTSTDGCSVSLLERHSDALRACIQAATYPSDATARQHAAGACRSIDVDYIDVLAQVTTKMGVEPDEARWRLADHIAGLVGQLRARGAFVREGILSSGYRADALGMPITDDQED